MGYEKSRKGCVIMDVTEYMLFGEDYYGHNFGFHTKRASCLFDYAKQYNEIPWKCAKTVAMEDKISCWQVIYALSEITGKHLFQTIKAFVDKLKGFYGIFVQDEFGRWYVTYENYLTYAKANKKVFRLENVKKKEIGLWLLRL